MKIFLLFGDNKGIHTFLLLLLFTFAAFTTSFAQVKFSAVCADNQISRNEYLQVQYIVENASNVQQIVPPSFKNFSIVSGPNQQSSMSNINGSIKQFIAIEFILKPDKPGNFKFSPAIAMINGKTLRSNSLSISVSKSTTGATPGGTSVSPFGNIITDVLPANSQHKFDDYILHKGENLSEKISKNLFVRLEVNKTTCYVGEPIVATYKLYTRLKSESNLIKSPSFNGFSVSEIDMPDSYNLSTEKYNGREYSVYILRKVQLYPLQPGNVELEPVEVENHITFIKAEYANAKNGDIFYDMLRDFADATTPPEGIDKQTITLQSKPLAIIVKPLPEINQPKNFKGAVGDFNVHVTLEKNSITTDEAGNLAVSISGKGNLQMVNSPAVSWPDGLEAYESKSIESIDNTAVPLKGEKKFTYPFTASRAGKYVIAAINFCYFDIVAQAYKTITTTPLTVEVKKGAGTRPAISGKLNTTKDALNASKNRSINNFWLLAIAAVIVLGFLAFLWLRSPRNNSSGTTPLKEIVEQEEVIPGKNEEAQIPQDPLHDAEKMLLQNNSGAFYYTLNIALRKYLALKLSYPEKELNKKKINELLDKHHVGLGTTLMLSSLLENIELNTYAPLSSADQLQEVYEKAGEVISLLDKQLG